MCCVAPDAVVDDRAIDNGWRSGHSADEIHHAERVTYAQRCRAFDASQTPLNMVAFGYSLGLAASVLWLGAVGDRYGRTMLLLIGVALSLPACLVAAWAPSIGVLIGARIVGGLATGVAHPTTP